MLKQRIITAAVGLPLLLGLILFGGHSVIFTLLMVCTALSVYEVANMFLPALASKVGGGNLASYHRFWTFFCVTVGCALFWISTSHVFSSERGGIVIALVVMLVTGTFSAKNIDRAVVNMSGFILSVTYGCLPWLSVWDLYRMGEHASHLLVTLAIVMMGDSGAYFAGKRFGRRALAPLFSPKKTWEGFLGGLLASILGAQLINLLFSFTIAPWWVITIAAILGGIAGVLGDLIESAFKRFAGVKDSGAIFPGHGGFLDRTDSLLIAAPVVWFVFYCYHSYFSL